MKAHGDAEALQWMQVEVIQPGSIVNCYDIPTERERIVLRESYEVST